MEFLTRLRRFMAESKNKTRSAWKNLVLSIVDDKPPSEEDVLKQLQQLGRTPDDLEVAIKVVKRRREDREKLQAANVAIAEKTKAEKKLAVACDKFAPIEKAHDELVESLSWEISRGNDANIQANDIRRRLIDTCTDEEALASLEAAMQSERNAQLNRESVRTELKNLSDVIQRDRTTLSNSEVDAERAALQVNIERYEQRWNETKLRMDRAEIELKSASKNVEDCRLKLIDTDL